MELGLLSILAFEAAWGFIAWRALKTGELPTFGGYGDVIRRSNNPSMFWSGVVILLLMMAGVGFGTAAYLAS
ncbi:hypothetical protein [Phenylobacterium sp.]|uniref:hypothetical protein n=1 Tax=Phenylobacterium sp. TaxID=1871053 RepID=UPI003BA88094